MPLVQRVLLYRWRQYVEARDDTFKWQLLPDSELRQRAFFAEAQDRRLSRTDAGMPFLEALPAIAQTYHARLRQQRETDLLRVVEALRLYAAAHGAWPADYAELTTVSATDVSGVSIPLDAVTGKAFQYSVSGRVAILSAPAAQFQGHLMQASRYELTLRKPAADK
jgi:hypothetical protein